MTRACFELVCVQSKSFFTIRGPILLSQYGIHVHVNVAVDTGSGVYQRGKAFGPCLWGVVNHCFPCDSPYTLVTRVAPFKQFLGVEQPKYGNCDLTDLECWGYIKNATPHSEDFYQDETTAGATFFFDPIEAYTFSACVLLSMVFTRIY